MQAGYDVLRLARRRHQAGAAVLRGLRKRQPAQRHVRPTTTTRPRSPGRASRRPTTVARPAFVRGGIVYRPLPELAFKVDLQIALDGEGPPPAPPMTLAGAPGTPRPLDPELALPCGRDPGRPGRRLRVLTGRSSAAV